MSDYVISAILRVKDELSGKTKEAKDSLSGVKSAAEGASVGLDHTESAMKKAATSAVALAAKADKVKAELSGLRGTYAPTLSVKDRATEKITGIKGMLNGLSGKAYTATVNVRQHLSGAAGVASGLAGKAGGALSGMAGGMMMNTSMQMAGAAGIGMGMYDAIKTYKDFEAQMSTVGALSSANAEELERLTAKAREMGAQSVFSATEAGKAFEYMAMAGYNTEQMVSSIKPMLNLAAAGGTDLGLTSDIITDAMSAFQMEATTANVKMFADTVAKAATSANTDVAKMGYTFQYLATSAGSLGYSIQDTALAIDLVADMGIKGEKAGTGLMAVLTGLASPSKEAAEAMFQYGITLDDGTGKAKPLRQTMLELRDVFKKLNPLEQQNLAHTLAGVDGMKSLNAIVGASDERFQALADSIDHATDSVEENGKIYDGWSEMVASKRTDNLTGDLKALSSAWDEFTLSMMTGTGGNLLRDLVQGVKADVVKLTGYLEDGFDISDIGRSAMDVLVQLKNKFIELDGVGSLLAGGALAGGLYKIVSLSKKAIDGIKGLGGAGKPVPGGTAAGVGEMVVNAGTVIVNGKGVAGGAGASGTTGGAGAPKGTPKGRFGGASRVAKGLGALALLDAGLNIYDAYSTNAQASAEAQYGVDAARENLEQKELQGTATDEDRAALLSANVYQAETEAYNVDRMGTAVGSGAGALAGGLLGAKAGAAGGAAIGALFGGVGAAPGALIGSLLGGVAGAFGGSELGGMIGSGIAENFDGAVAGIKTKWDELETGIASGCKRVAASAVSEWESIKQEAASSLGALSSWFGDNVWKPIADSGIEKINLIAGAASMVWSLIQPQWESAASWFDSVVWQPVASTAEWAWNGIREAAVSAKDFIFGTWENVSAWFDAVVWQPVIGAAEWAWSGISSAASAVREGVFAVWGGVSSWFDSTVWQPITGAVESVKTSVVGAFDAALSGVKSIWSGVADWFDANVISPLREKFSSLIDLKNSIADAGSAITGLTTSNGTGHNAIGTSFWEGGWTEVNENGGEIIDLPQGSRVYPHATTMKMLRDSMDSSGGTSVSTAAPVTITGNTFHVREEADLDRIAYKLYQLMAKSHVNMNGGVMA